MSVLYFEAFGRPPATVAGTERFHLLHLVREQGLALGGPPLEPGHALSLAGANRCLAAGPDALRLAARLAAQAEIYCWVDGPNRRWLAWLIDAGLEAGYFRPSVGWERVQALLLAGDEAPVYVSTSQVEQMPARPLALSLGLVTAAELEELPAQEQWGLVELALRLESAQEDRAAGSDEFTAPLSREMRPSNWADYFFAV